MNWSTKQMTLPLLIGVSLTGVCVGLYYFFYKKDEDEEKLVTLRDKKFVTREIKVPRQLVPAVIGRAGATIKSIEQRTSTKIRFSPDEITDSVRICTVRGAPEHVTLAEALINDIIENQPVIETYEMFVPQRVRSTLLADRGEIVNAIQTSSKAKIILEKGYCEDPEEKRRVIIKGSAEQIAAALYHIEDIVRESNAAQEKLEVSQSTRSPRGKISPRSTVINTTENQVQNQEEHALAPEKTMEIYVSAAESPSQFWIQVVGPGTPALDDLVAAMTNYYNVEENQEIHKLNEIKIGQTVAAKFSYDERWYRAEITNFLDNEKYEVFFLDYGDHEVMEAKDILELRTDFLSLRLQAIECCLANVKPKDDDWSDEACERFGELCWVAQWNILTAKVRGYKERISSGGNSRREGSPIPCIDLYDKQGSSQLINIGRQLVIENLALSEDGTWSAASSTLSLSKRSQELPPTLLSTPVSTRSAITVDNNSTPKCTPRFIEEIDLTTPKRESEKVEEIDLVTPNNNNRTKQFIASERKNTENGSGDYRKNADDEYPVHSQWRMKSGGIPAGAESQDEDEGELEIF